MDPLLHSVPESRRILGGLGKTKLYELFASGELESVLVGDRRMVTARSLRAFVEKLAASEPASEQAAS